MKRVFILSFFLVNSFTQGAFGYVYEHHELQQLSSWIEQSLKAKNISDLKIERILGAYQSFKRYEATAEDVLELKFQMAHWRKYTAEALIADASKRALRRKPGEKHPLILSYLQKLNIKLTPIQLKTLEDLWGKELLSSLSFEPQKQIKIVPIKPSAWPFERWGKVTEFSRYEFKEGGVFYRGLTLYPGDIFLANLNHGGDGVYTAMSDPRSSFSHFAFLAFLQKDGRLYPAAIEIYELGVRAVPLSVFLSPQFTPYLEVYRFKKIPSGWRETINVKAAEMLHEIHAYNFYFDVNDDTYLSCTNVGSCIFKKTGVVPILWKSEFKGAIGENVKKLGLEDLRLLTPIDYMLSNRLDFIGVVDNNDFLGEVQKELVLRRIRNLFQMRVIDPERFPLEFKLNRWGIQKIRSGSKLGNLFMWVEGFRRETFPKGPTDGMALVEIFEAQTKKSVDQSKEIIEKEINRDLFSLFSMHDLEDRVEIQAALDQKISNIADWFIP